MAAPSKKKCQQYSVQYLSYGFVLLGLGGLVLKLTLTQYYKQNLFKQNLLMNYKNIFLSQNSSVMFFIILLPVCQMVCSHVSIYSKHHQIS